IVSKASEDLPDPDSPVITTRLSRGRSTSMFLRLCSRAPRIRICCCMRKSYRGTSLDATAGPPLLNGRKQGENSNPPRESTGPPPIKHAMSDTYESRPARPNRGLFCPLQGGESG